MNKQQAKEKIKKLVERYEKLSNMEKKKYNEQQTKDHFIRPLFEALGWDFEHEVWPETDVSGKRVDYAFKIDGNTKFYTEAKAIPVNLDEERWAEQAINYSWHKSVPWVVLTDFEGIKVFNTEWDEPDIQSCRFIEIPWTEYLTSEKLWWLSREAFQKGILDKKADEVGKRPKRIIDDQLASDLIRWRNYLAKDLEGYNPKIDIKKISQYVQKILDRLIFIRTLEDRKIEDVILQPLARNWQEKKGIKTNQLLQELNKVFRKIDKTYNSGLFEKCACDFLGGKIEADDNTFVDVINELYKTENKGIRYNFADIPADIFGNIYEQYLGHIQKEDAKEKKTSKRKSQGIYYTPRYIVNYIVQNTLGEILKDKTPVEIKNLKILDPACGSGSFLISAYQALIDFWQTQKRKQKQDRNGKFKDLEKAFKKRNGDLLSSTEKMRILLNNIFGVDLDEEAVEFAKLNLLLKMVDSQIKLPKLSRNIQEGNSLISGNESELKKYFGKNWKDKKPFEWEDEFRNAFSEKKLCAYHITWVTHNSRISERMIEYKIKKGPGLWLEEKDEIKIAGFIRDIVKEDDLRVLAFNICGDHVHMFLVCTPDEVANIVRKLKGKSAQKYKDYLKIGKEEKFHLWAQKFSKTIIRPSREGKSLYGNNGLQPIVAEDIRSHFHNTIEYIRKNREKHNLPSNKGLQPLVADMLCDIDSAFAPQYKSGFDVVIGNPPYIDVRKIKKEDKKYLFDKFSCTENRTNTFSIFIEASLSVLNEGGYLGFIIPNTILTHSSYKKMREKILNECIISKIYDLGKDVFQEATVETVVIVLKKEKNEAECNKNVIQVCRVNNNDQTDYFNIKQSIFKSDSLNRFILSSDKKVNVLIKKLKSKSINLGTIYHGYNGINPGNKRGEVVVNKKINKKYKKVIDGKHIKRYAIKWGGDWVLYDRNILERARKEKIFLEKPKIMLQKIGTNLVASLDEDKLYALINTTILLKEKGEYDPRYILALLNSKLLNFFYKEEFLGVQIKTEFLEILPICKINFSNKKEKAKYDKLVKLADQMLKLNKKLQKLDPIMDDKEYKEIKEEIEKTDEEIDERIFELYGLGEEEIKIIEK